MEIIQNLLQFHIEEKTAVAIGKFDGIHVGHQKLLAEIIKKKEQGMKACVFTFDPPPSFFFGLTDGKEITTREEKREQFDKMGIDILVEFPLTQETANMSPEDFVDDILVKQMNVGFVAAGEDLSFGKKGMGNAALLMNKGKHAGFTVEIIEKVFLDGTMISSSLAREEIQKGNMERAALILGSPYSISGEVVHGRKLGRKIGMPTVNLIPPAQKLLPPNGVYYSRVQVEGTWQKGITNIGCKPTVTNEMMLGVETYLYDYAADVYGKQILVELLSFKRPEMKFADVESLKAQMEQDIKEGSAFHKKEEM